MLAALAASEQKLAESTQWLEMMGLSWNQTSQDTQVSPAEKLAPSEDRKTQN